jgi:hypothetical protein
MPLIFTALVATGLLLELLEPLELFGVLELEPLFVEPVVELVGLVADVLLLLVLRLAIK